MKKWLTSLVALLLVFAIAIPVQAKASGISVYYNGEKLDLTEPAFVEKGKTYVPLRSFFEELDYEVRYKGSKKQIILDYYGYESIIHLKNNQVTEYDEVIIEKLDVIYRNHTYYAPIRELEPVTITTTSWNSAMNSIYVDDYYVEPEPEFSEPSEGFLWKVSKGENTVYMLGSIHVGNDDLYPLRDEINEAYEAADKLVTEVDITREPTDAEMAAIEKLFTYQDGTTLKDHLTPEGYKALMELAGKIGIQGEGLKEFQKLQVWFINMMLSSEIDEGDDAEPGSGIDMHFLEKAIEDKLPTGELESYLVQYEMLAGFSPELQEQLLLETVMQYEYALEGYEVGAGTDYLMYIWAEGDLESLDEMAKSMKKGAPEYYDSLLTKRNVGMTDKIEKYLNDTQTKTYLVIAGALHFAGEDSIIAMLEKRGYTVERL